KDFAYMREQAEPVDKERLEEILKRDQDASEPESAAAGETPDGGRDSKFPPPPEDAERPVKLHELSFVNQLFSPQGGIEAALISAIGAAKTSVEIAMFSFYSQKVADALLAARAANPDLKVRILLDYSQSKLGKLD